MNIFDDEFNMQSYINKRLMDIEDLNSRQVFKDVVGKLFVELHQEIETEYKALEKRVFAEVPTSIMGPEIVTNIVSRKKYDVTDKYLLPMRQEDIKVQMIDVDKLLESLTNKKAFYLYPVFLKADYLTVKRFNNPNRIFKGIVKTSHNEYTASFTICPNTFYRQKIKQLYDIFQINYLPWSSICGAYLYKLFDVYIIDIENWDGKETIIESKVDFEEYEDDIYYDQVPLWNIQEFMVKTSTYPEPCIDKVNYEHRIFKKKFKDEARYLITNKDIAIMNIRWYKGDLIISCPEEKPVEWKLFQCNQVMNKKYPNLTLTNGQKPTFAAKIRDYYAQKIKTKQEITRLIESYVISDFLEFNNIALIEGDIQEESYFVDDFIEDEIRSGMQNQVLRLDFVPKDKNFYLNRDIMSFLVSNVQRYFPEFRCCGRLL